MLSNHCNKKHAYPQITDNVHLHHGQECDTFQTSPLTSTRPSAADGGATRAERASRSFAWATQSQWLPDILVKRMRSLCAVALGSVMSIGTGVKS
eukprot:6212945-Pleurochrysis_carterae.AAC.4